MAQQIQGARSGGYSSKHSRAKNITTAKPNNFHLLNDPLYDTDVCDGF